MDLMGGEPTPAPPVLSNSDAEPISYWQKKLRSVVHLHLSSAALFNTTIWRYRCAIASDIASAFTTSSLRVSERSCQNLFLGESFVDFNTFAIQSEHNPSHRRCEPQYGQQ